MFYGEQWKPLVFAAAEVHGRLRDQDASPADRGTGIPGQVHGLSQGLDSQLSGHVPIPIPLCFLYLHSHWVKSEMRQTWCTVVECQNLDDLEVHLELLFIVAVVTTWLIWIFSTDATVTQH